MGIISAARRARSRASLLWLTGVFGLACGGSDSHLASEPEPIAATAVPGDGPRMGDGPQMGAGASSDTDGRPQNPSSSMAGARPAGESRCDASWAVTQGHNLGPLGLTLMY